MTDSVPLHNGRSCGVFPVYILVYQKSSKWWTGSWEPKALWSCDPILLKIYRRTGLILAMMLEHRVHGSLLLVILVCPKWFTIAMWASILDHGAMEEFWSDESVFLHHADGRVHVRCLPGEELSPGFIIRRRQGWKSLVSGIHVDIAVKQLYGNI